MLKKKKKKALIKDLLPKKTVVVTNSSTLLPSKLAPSTGRPEKYLSLHFANSIWKNNTQNVALAWPKMWYPELS